MTRLFVLPFFLISACSGDETVAAYGGGGKTWKLQNLDGAPFSARATLTFPAPGQIAGNASCNSYHGAMTVPYPWFDTGTLAVTRRACPDMASEAAFLEALQDMSFSEVSGEVLILSNEAGREMIFSSGG
jgi:heat shock protein HslJ